MTRFARDQASHLHEGDFHDSIIGESSFQNQVCNAVEEKVVRKRAKSALHHKKCHPWVRFGQGYFCIGLHIWRMISACLMLVFETTNRSGFSRSEGNKAEINRFCLFRRIPNSANKVDQYK